MANHPLTQAAREVNQYSETHGLEETCEHYNLKVEDVRYVAEQRAFRAIAASQGINMKTQEDLDRVMILPSQLIAFTAAYMDGLVIGWRAREIMEEENKEK